MEKTGLPKNMQMFNSLTINIFDVLYDTFPKPTDIDTLKIGSRLNLAADKDDVSSAATIAENTLQWLSAEGFIRYKIDLTRPANDFTGVQLTLKSLKILDSVPSSTDFGEDPDTTIVMIRKALASGSSEGIKKALKAFIG